MTSKRLAILLVLLSVSFNLCGQTSIAYPAKKGAVSDYAGKLSGAQIEELTGLIQRYERQTSIEFAVVVVDSLHGRSAREYAIGLGNFWQVGKAGRNNGIVLLWAPNERAYSLRIADGLTPDLSDADAALLTRQHLLPDFKRGEYYAGLKDTVQATMAYLGDQTWEERIQARAQAAEQRQRVEAQRRQEQAQQAAQAAEQDRLRRQQAAEQDRLQRQQAEQQADEVARFALRFVLFLGIAGLAGFVVYRWRTRKRELAELAQANGAIAASLGTAETNAPQVQRLLDDFAKEAPEQDLASLRADLAGQADRILKIKLDATLVDFTNLRSYDQMVQIKTRANNEADLLQTMQGRIGDIRVAKQRSQAMLDQLSKEQFQISEVRDSSRRSQVDQLLASSRQDYEQARQNSSMSLVNWLIINDLLSRSHSQVQQAVQYSQEAPYVPPPSFSSSDSSSSSFSSSSSGGGGGFSGGSGSDGTY